MNDWSGQSSSNGLRFARGHKSDTVSLTGFEKCPVVRRNANRHVCVLGCDLGTRGRKVNGGKSVGFRIGTFEANGTSDWLRAVGDD